jgi:hypothetical protein
MHLPFNMNTRYRMPLIDPLLAALAGIGAAALLARVELKDRAILPNAVVEY